MRLTMKRVERLRKRPLRQCACMHECVVCGHTITPSQCYYDGGIGGRAHKSCIDDIWMEKNK